MPRGSTGTIARTGLFLVVVVAAAAGGWLLRSARAASTSGDLHDLVSLAPRTARTVEARLSGGFAFAPLHGQVRGEAGTPLRLSAAIDAAVARASSGTTAESRAAAVAEMLRGRPRDALLHLDAVPHAARDASFWADFAAANYETAIHYGASELLATAFAACDVSLAKDRRNVEALFNRAVVLQRLGLRDDAREAWRAYLDAAPSDEWSIEAMRRLHELRQEKSFAESVWTERDLAVNPARADHFVARDPFGVRATGIVDVLGAWARHFAANDAAAARELAIARQLGAALRRAGEDGMLAAAVEAIDRSDAPARLKLAEGHREYAAGIAAVRESEPHIAEEHFRRADAAFAAAGSPMVLPARYFLANMWFEQRRRDDSEMMIRTLLASAPRDFSAYRAHLVWQLGIIAVSRARWGEALSNLERAADAFGALGERQNVGAVERLIAVVYDRTGDHERAWRARIAALNGIGGQSTLPLEKAAASIADAAIFRRDWSVAASFLTLEIAIAERLHDDVQAGPAYFARAVVRDRLADPAAFDDIGAGGLRCARVRDAAYRDILRVTELRATAMLTSTPPIEAARLLTEAIDFHAQMERLDLPALLLQRARARRRAGDLPGCRADLWRGIAELERQRASLPEGEARWGAFETATELFSDAIDVYVSEGDAATAFRLAERGRARALMETYGASPDGDLGRLPSGSVVVEYATLPTRTIIFTATAHGVEATAVARTREELVTAAGASTRAANDRSSARVNAAMSSLYTMLVAPVASKLYGTSEIVFVPDAATAPVPFSALRDDAGHYLIERTRVVVAPSAAAFVSLASRVQRAPASTAVVIDAGTPAGEFSTLPFAHREAEAVTRVYPSVSRIDGDVAAGLAAGAEVVHFVGHGIGDESGIEASSLVSRSGGQGSRLTAGEIAAMKLPKTRVIVLAGCATARGAVRAAEGVVSVAYAFLAAGAPSVIATLWDVDDEQAAAFFPRVHQKIAGGLAPADALRAVQLEAIHRGDPITMWAAVQDIGH